MINKETLQPFKNLFSLLLPYMTVILSVLQLAFSAINSISTCKIDNNYIQQFNNTVIFDAIGNHDITSLNISLAAIISVFTVILALFNDQTKKQKKKIELEHNNLQDKFNTLSMRSYSLQHEPFDMDTPHDSVITDYPRVINIPSSPEDREEA